MRVLNCRGIQFDPAGIGQFNKTTCGGLEPKQVGRTQLQAFLFPFRGNREPIDAAALDDQAGAQLPGSKKKALESGVRQIVGFVRTILPSSGEVPKNASLASPTQSPGSGVNQSNCRSQRWRAPGEGHPGSRVYPWSPLLVLELPFVAIPEPQAVVAITPGQ